MAWYVNISFYAQDGSLLDVHIVIYAMDKETAKAAAEAMYPQGRVYYAGSEPPYA